MTKYRKQKLKQKVNRTLTALGLLSVTFVTGALTFSTHTTQAQEVITLTQATTTPPVLARIFTCESHNHQYAPSGQVLMKPNTNGTVDVGIAQINTVWFAQATALHLDITTEAGNKAMALWIYQNKGTAPWYSSAHCWNK